jgi:hypothetical protein
MAANSWRKCWHTAAVSSTASTATPAAIKSTCRLLISTTPNSEAAGMPARPLDPPVTAGVSNSISCKISPST